MKKVLIFYTSVGLGHKAIADNIGDRLQESGHEVRREDVLSVQSGRLVDWSVAVHQFINRNMGWLWAWLYFGTNTWVSDATLGLRLWIAGRNSERVKKMIDEYHPDIIITTQNTASAVVCYLRKQKLYTGKFGIGFSDYHLHRFWLFEADFYLANIEEQKKEMVRLGFPAGKIFITGFSFPPRPAVDLPAVKNKFNIAPDEKAVLITSGSLGLGIHDDLLKTFGEQQKVKTLVVCGKNQALYEKLSKQFGGSSVTVLGFYQPMRELYAIADIFITKPGGLSSSEALLYNLPILISHFLPGQEELNLPYMYEKGLIMPKTANIRLAALEELQTGSFRKSLQQNPNVKALFPGKAVLLSAIQSLI